MLFLASGLAIKIVGPEVQDDPVLFAGTFVEDVNQFKVIGREADTGFFPTFPDEGFDGTRE